MTDTLRERIVRYLNDELDSLAGKPEPDAWLVEVEDDEGWHRAAVRLDEQSARDTCKTWPSPLRVTPLYRRSKHPGAVISEPPPDHAGFVEARSAGLAAMRDRLEERRKVHNHGPEDGPSVACRETLIGDCMREQIARRARIEAYREAAEYLEEQMHVPTVAAAHLLRQRADELEAGGSPA